MMMVTETTYLVVVKLEMEMNKLIKMKNTLIIGIIVLFNISFLKAQQNNLNYKNFFGPVLSSYKLTSSKVILEDTFDILEKGQNRIWDFSRFGEISNNSFPIITYSFIPEENSWLLDSATDRIFWSNPEFDYIIRESYNDSIIDVNGKFVLNFKDWFFKVSDTSLFFVGSASSSLSKLNSTPGVENVMYFESIRSKKISELPLTYGKEYINESTIDTIGSSPTFWTIQKLHLNKSIDASGKIIFPFGEVNNAVRLVDMAIVETEKLNKNTGDSNIDSILEFKAFWIQPELQYSIPIVRLEMQAEKTVGNNWVFSTIESYISDKQSLSISNEKNLANWSWFYPNPANNMIYLNKKLEAKTFTIYSINGQKVFNGVISENKILIEHLASNIYILEVFDGKLYHRSKLLIQ